MKIALVYDRVNKWGGAERVLLALHELFPEAPLYTSVYHKETAPWAKSFTIKTSFLQKIPYLRSHHELVPFLMPLAFESFSFDEYDLVISITSEAAKGIITRGKTKHICYCLTPTRYLWSGYEEYFGKSLFSFITKPLISHMRKGDIRASQRPDAYIAISKEVCKRIKKYYNRDSAVVYPPLTEFKSGKSKPLTMKSGYFLIVSRLSKFTQYKRIDLAIKACNELHLPLKIIGSGNWETELQAMAGPSVEFLGNVSDEKLATYYKSCNALVFPGTEDFGLTIIEAQYFGKPVIAYRAGGATETIIEGKTGVFFSPQNVEALKQVLRQFDSRKFKAAECSKQAARFNKAQFKKAFLSELKNLIEL